MTYQANQSEDVSLKTAGTVPVERVAQIIEELACGWDDCTFDVPAGWIEIGDAIRAHGADLLALATPALPPQAKAEPAKLWLWKNFVDGRPEYWAFDNPYPVHLDCGDPQTLGEPCGYALFKPSRQGRTDVPESKVLAAIALAQAKAEPAGVSDEAIYGFARAAGLPMSWLDEGKASAWPELLAFARAILSAAPSTGVREDDGGQQ